MKNGDIIRILKPASMGMDPAFENALAVLTGPSGRDLDPSYIRIIDRRRKHDKKYPYFVCNGYLEYGYIEIVL